MQVIDDIRHGTLELRKVHGDIAAACMAGLSFLLPLAPVAVPPLAVITAVLLVMRHRAAGGWRSVSRGPGLLAAACFFLLYVIGLAWTRNFGYAFFDLEVKLPLLLIPVAVLLVPAGARAGGRSLLALFVAGNALATIACIMMIPVHLFMQRGDLASQVFGSDFSLFLHPSYFALYQCFALAAVLLGSMRSEGVTGRVLPIVLIAGIVLTGSKMGWLCLLLLLVAVLVLRWRDPSVRHPLLRMLAGAVAIASIAIALSANLRERLVEAWRASSHAHLDPQASTSSEVRKLAWRSAQQVVAQEWPLGAGTGDVKDELIRRHEANGYTHLVEKRINAHSQYLQTVATLGLPGLLGIAALLLVPLVMAWRSRDRPAIVFLLLSALNWTVESMLEVKAGTDFHAWALLALAFMDEERPSRT